jgi:ubiquinone/menaquinone biosynthesis C-methylase UbiE
MATKERRRKKRRKGPTLAQRADRHRLYEASVQNVEHEVDFIKKTFRQLTGRQARSFREDFCGTGAAACAWARRNRRHRAVGIDLDEEVLAWGRSHHQAALEKGARKRVSLVHGNVLDADTGPVDIVGAFNFSYWIFQERDEMLRYFRRVRESLEDDGVFFLDHFGGSDAMLECREKTSLDGFTYVWEQASYEPISGHYVCHIHFHFPDGSKLKRAFTYVWRLWTLPEIMDLLDEAGFRETTVFWETEDEQGEPTGEFEAVGSGANDPAFVVYLAARP